MKSKRISVLLMTILMLASSSLITAQPQEKHKHRAEIMLEMAFHAKEKANETIDAAYAAGISSVVIAEAVINYTTGEDTWELANATFYGIEPAPEEDWYNYTKASELALEAMHEFKAAIATIMEYWTQPPVGSAVWRVLEGKIQRAEDFLDRVAYLVGEAKTKYPTYDFTVIDSKLSQAEQQLEYAQANITALNMNMTVTSLIELNKNLHQISAELKRMGHSPALKGKRIANFIEKQLTKFIEKAQELADEKGENITDELLQVNAKIEEAETLAGEGDLKGAMEKVKEAHKLLRDLLRELRKGGGQSQGKGQGKGKP